MHRILFTGVALALMTVGAAAQCSITNQTACSIGSAGLEVNLGPVPIDLYNLPPTTVPQGGGGPIYPNCTESTIQNCILDMLSTTATGNYQSQGVTGVRFQFGLGGDRYASTAFIVNSDGTYGGVNPAWLANLTTFFSDLKGYGIQNITITPALTAPNVNPGFKNTSPTGACGQPVLYLKWVPFGLSSATTTYGFPECHGSPLAYGTANAPNSVIPKSFWGWKPFFTLMNLVLQSASQKGLKVSEIDLENELDLFDFTVSARLIYDNQNDLNGNVGGTTDVLTTIRKLMSKWGFDPTQVTYSVQVLDPTTDITTDCLSPYGGSGTLFYLQELNYAFNYGSNSGNGTFGNPNGLSNNSSGLPCPPPNNPVSLTGLSSLPVAYVYTSNTQVVQQNVSAVTDVHFFNCILGQDAHNDPICLTSPAVNLPSVVYTSALPNYLSAVNAHQLPAPAVLLSLMLGEVNSSQRDILSGPGYPQQYITYCVTPQMTAFQNVAGFMSSPFFANPPAYLSKTTFRPWENPADYATLDPYCWGGYAAPNAINPPYKKGN
jgi:hypothetical protein